MSMHNQSTFRVLIAAALVVAIVVAAPSNLRAYVHNENRGLDSNGERAMYPICGTVTLPGPSSSERTSGNATKAIENALDMWSRDGLVRRAWYYFPSPSCVPGAPDGSWWNGSCPLAGSCDDNLNEIGWVPQHVVDSFCDGVGMLGCEGTVKRRVGGGVGNSSVNESDVVIATSFMFDQPWRVVNQNTLAECLGGELSMESLALHEIGHSYGLGHEESTISLMNAHVPPINHCHVLRSFNTYPFADEFHGKSVSNSTVNSSDANVTGAMWFRHSDGTVGRVEEVFFTGATELFEFSLESHYRSNPAINVRIVLLADGAIPTNDWVGYLYTPAHTLLSYSQPAGSIGAGRTVKISRAVAIPENVIPVGIYRVWIHIDAPLAVVETDDFDNMFPTAMLVREL